VVSAHFSLAPKSRFPETGATPHRMEFSGTTADAPFVGKDAPCTRPIERFGDIIAQPILVGYTIDMHEPEFSEATQLLAEVAGLHSITSSA
jgi:hypothetical protein